MREKQKEALEAAEERASAKRRPAIRTLKRRIEIQGLAIIDKRTAGAQQLLSWRSELLTALGGEENLSPQRKTLIELAVRGRLLVDHVDAYILSLPTIIIRRKKAIMPLIMQRTQLAEALQKTLERLGLEKRTKPVEDLDAFLERKARERAEATGNEAETEEPSEHDDHRGNG